MTMVTINTIANGTAAYAANDVVGGLVTIPLSDGYNADKYIILNSVDVIENGTQKPSLTVFVFDALPSTIADNAAFAPTVADFQKKVAAVPLASYSTFNSISYAESSNVNELFSSSNGNLYAYVVATGTVTYASASALTLRLTVLER